MGLEYETPLTPNFIRAKLGKRQITVSIADLEDWELSAIADKWKEKLLKNAQEKRKET